MRVGRINKVLKKCNKSKNRNSFSIQNCPDDKSYISEKINPLLLALFITTSNDLVYLDKTALSLTCHDSWRKSGPVKKHEQNVLYTFQKEETF